MILISHLKKFIVYSGWKLSYVYTPITYCLDQIHYVYHADFQLTLKLIELQGHEMNSFGNLQCTKPNLNSPTGKVS